MAFNILAIGLFVTTILLGILRVPAKVVATLMIWCGLVWGLFIYFMIFLLG